MKLKTLSLIAICLFCNSCAETQYEEQQTNTLSYDTYKINNALNVGRVDIAKTVSDDMTIYVTKPKTPATVYSVAGYAVLPDNYNNLKVIYYSDLLKNKTLMAELAKEKLQTIADLVAAKAQATQDKQVQDGLIKQVAELKKEQTDYENSIFYKTYAFFHSLSWIVGIASFLGIGGTIALCVFCPALIPIVISTIENILVDIISVAYSIFKGIITLVSKL